MAHLLSAYNIGVHYDVIKKRLVIWLPKYVGTPDNRQESTLRYVESLAALNRMATGSLFGFVHAIGDANPINPVLAWIAASPWDGVDRLPDIYATLTCTSDYPNELKEVLVHRWLLSAVAAAVVPNFSCRGVLTFQGRQGLGKTRWFESLVPDPVLRAELIRTGHHLDPRSKDDVLGAITHWVVELGELDSTLRKDVAALKAFLSNNQDKVRRPYGRAESEYPRRTVFAASVNEHDFLVDSTGNARFWTLPLVKIDYEHGIDMQQVFAQLHTEIRSGESWRLQPDEQAALDKVNLAHRTVSAIRERVWSLLDIDKRDSERLPALTASDVLGRLGYKTPTNPQCKECASALREFLGEPKKINGSMKWRVPMRDGPLTIDEDELY